MRLAWLVPVLLCGCIVFDETPEGDFQFTESQAFLTACSDNGLDRAIGCVATCGVGASPALGIERNLFRHVGAGASYAADLEADPFDARCGRAEWRVCTENVFDGLQCERRNRNYCAKCTGDGVVLADENGFKEGRPVVPGQVLLGSVLPEMMQGRFRGESGSCLAACIAAVSRPSCEGGCRDGEGCLETGFGDVCHPRGQMDAGRRCHGDQDCRSLKCNAEGQCE